MGMSSGFCSFMTFLLMGVTLGNRNEIFKSLNSSKLCIDNSTRLALLLVGLNLESTAVLPQSYFKGTYPHFSSWHPYLSPSLN